MFRQAVEEASRKVDDEAENSRRVPGPTKVFEASNDDRLDVKEAEPLLICNRIIILRVAAVVVVVVVNRTPLPIIAVMVMMCVYVLACQTLLIVGRVSRLCPNPLLSRDW